MQLEENAPKTLGTTSVVPLLILVCNPIVRMNSSMSFSLLLPCARAHLLLHSAFLQGIFHFSLSLLQTWTHPAQSQSQSLTCDTQVLTPCWPPPRYPILTAISSLIHSHPRQIPRQFQTPRHSLRSVPAHLPPPNRIYALSIPARSHPRCPERCKSSRHSTRPC